MAKEGPLVLRPRPGIAPYKHQLTVLRKSGKGVF